MSGLYLSRGLFPQEYLRPTVDFILDSQEQSGAIPWFRGGHLDPWDHVEAAMGLTIGGEHDAAVRAYQWLQQNQLEDGSWWAAYREGEVENTERRESNFVAYVAAGVWHHYLVTSDQAFLQSMWSTVEAAIEFVLRLQTEHGEIHDGIAAVLAEHRPQAMAVENLFNARNARASLILGHARGVVLLAGAQAALTVAEYAPREVKKAITGNGAAAKEQVRFMVMRLLALRGSLPLDQSDALAVAIAHVNRSRYGDLLARGGST